MSLTQDQEYGAKVFTEFLDDPDARAMLLTGGPGVGKSYLVANLLKSLPGGMEVALTTPTNKAVRVIRKLAEDAGITSADTLTIYSLFGLRLMPNGEVKSIGAGGRNRAGEYHLVVCDEASMVNPHLMSCIEAEMRDSVTKWLIVGDRDQITPINFDFSPAFDITTAYSVELTKVVRQAEGNPILELLPFIREGIHGAGIPWKALAHTNVSKETGNGVFVFHRDNREQKARFAAWMKAGYSTKKYGDDGDYMKTIAWVDKGRAKTIPKYTRAIRRAIYGDAINGHPVLVGEKILCANPIQDYDGDEPMIIAPIDSEGVIMSCEEGLHPIAQEYRYGDFKCWCLKIYFHDIGTVDAWMIHEDSERAFYKKKQELFAAAKENSRLWGTFWKFNDMFADIRAAHAITAHRSQGSTYENVFVDVGDVLSNRDETEALKILYTAISRARSNVMLLI